MVCGGSLQPDDSDTIASTAAVNKNKQSVLFLSVMYRIVISAGKLFQWKCAIGLTSVLPKKLPKYSQIPNITGISS